MMIAMPPITSMVGTVLNVIQLPISAIAPT
jgi:hypothetical protein